jgi:hypothetical protein
MYFRPMASFFNLLKQQPGPKKSTLWGPRKANPWIVLFILSIAFAPRIALGFLNHESNDNHVDVVNFILANHSLPEKKDCWSCFQPKLYYVASAALCQILGITDDFRRVRAMQLLNVAISLFTLILLWKFINAQALHVFNKYLFFSLFALNPCLLGINVQSTNDTAAIFFGVLSVYAANKFFSNLRTGNGIILIIALTAGLLCKAGLWVLTGAIVLCFVIRLMAGTIQNKIKTAKFLLLLVITITVIVPFAGGYYDNYKKYNSLSLSTWEKVDPPPYFFKKTQFLRPGVESIFAAFFTFRYFDMIRQPYIINDGDIYPLHRTSLWSQLYGRTVFMHFDQWPPTWKSTTPFIVLVGRWLIALSIVPLFLFIAGILINALAFIQNLKKKNLNYFADSTGYIHLGVTLAFLLSSVYYSYHYRDFSAMKSIYIFPGFLAFIKMVVDGFSAISSKLIGTIVSISLMLIIILSLTDVAFLIYQLH